MLNLTKMLRVVITVSSDSCLCYSVIVIFLDSEETDVSTFRKLIPGASLGN